MTWKTVYANGAYNEVKLYKKPVKGIDDADRIRLSVAPEGEEPMTVYMHVFEAVNIIVGLSAAVREAMELKLPLWPKEPPA